MTTKRSKGWLPVVALLSLILLAGATRASAQHHGRHGYGHHGYGYRYGYSPYYRYLPGYGLHGYSGYGYGYYDQPVYQAQITGTVKLRVTPKTDTKAQVFINDALASEFKHKRSLSLAPGEYRIEVRKEGYQTEKRTVRVVLGETLKLDFALSPAQEPAGAATEPAQGNPQPAKKAPSPPMRGPVFLATRLSLSGSKLAIAAWSPGENSGSLRVYQLEDGQQLALDKPTRTFPADAEILLLEWAPDEAHIVALTRPAASAATPLQATVAGIRSLNLEEARWTKVGTVTRDGSLMEVSLVESLGSREQAFLRHWIENTHL